MENDSRNCCSPGRVGESVSITMAIRASLEAVTPGTQFWALCDSHRPVREALLPLLRQGDGLNAGMKLHGQKAEGWVPGELLFTRTGPQFGKIKGWLWMVLGTATRQREHPPGCRTAHAIKKVVGLHHPYPGEEAGQPRSAASADCVFHRSQFVGTLCPAHPGTHFSNSICSLHVCVARG